MFLLKLKIKYLRDKVTFLFPAAARHISISIYFQLFRARSLCLDIQYSVHIILENIYFSNKILRQISMERQLSFLFSQFFSNFKFCPENWLSPVIQATWEARTVGWLEKEELLPPGRGNSVAALRHPCDRKVNRGGKATMTRV